MPFFHDRDRSGLRRLYVEAWRRYRSGLPLEPLQHQIVAVIEQHPEYQSIVENESEALGRDFTPEAGQSSPFLHMGLHLAVRDQVATNRPPGITAIRTELTQQLGDPHEAEHRILERLGEALWLSQQTGQPPDELAYVESLRKLLHRHK
jgi:hypothetical protein